MRKQWLFVLAVLHFAAALLVLFMLINPVQASPTRSHVDPCASWDEWTGLPRFDYQVDAAGNWNLPDDVELVDTLTFPVGGIWVYTSAKEQTRYTIIFRDFEPDGKTYGNHHICVYKG